MSEEPDWDYYYHPEEAPGMDEVPDEEEVFEEMMRQYIEEEYGYYD